MNEPKLPAMRPRSLPAEPEARPAEFRSGEDRIIGVFERVSDTGRWALFTALFGGGVAVLVAQVGLSPLGGVLTGIGGLVGLVNLRMTRIGYEFPDTLHPRIHTRGYEPTRTWGVELDMENPGRADRFEVRLEEVKGARDSERGVGAYPKWKGQAAGDWKRIPRGDRGTIALCAWEPDPDEEGIGDDAAITSVIHASTGDTPVQLGSEAVTAHYGLERRELVLRLRVLSEKTERQARYDVHIGPLSTSDPSPRVSVERLPGP